MNLAIRGIEGQIAHGDSFHNDRHADLKADSIDARKLGPMVDRTQRELTDGDIARIAGTYHRGSPVSRQSRRHHPKR